MVCYRRVATALQSSVSCAPRSMAALWPIGRVQHMHMPTYAMLVVSACIPRCESPSPCPHWHGTGGAYTCVLRCSTIGAQGAWPLWQSHRRPPLVFLNTRLFAADAMVLRYMLQRNPAVGFIARAGNLRVDDRVNIAKLLVFAKRPRGLLVRH